MEDLLNPLTDSESNLLKLPHTDSDVGLDIQIHFQIRNSDFINIKLILVSGKTIEFLFNQCDSVTVITQHVYDNWPADWNDELRPPTNILRLIYQGRFLHGNVTLGGLHLLPGKTTVMHLVLRDSLPEPNSEVSDWNKLSEATQLKPYIESFHQTLMEGLNKWLYLTIAHLASTQPFRPAADKS